MEINASVLTAIAAVTGIILGTFLSPFLNHQLTLKYNRRDFMFKKKLEYFEQVALCIEENTKMYRRVISDIQSPLKKKDEEKVLEEIKKERKKFKILASPLYFNIEEISSKIKKFVDKEKEIFSSLEKAKEMKDSEESKKIKEKLGGDLKELISLGEDIVQEMRSELGK